MRILLMLTVTLLLLSCNRVSDENFGAGNDLPDNEGYYLAQSGSFALRYKVAEAQFLECILEGNSSGWIAVGFNPTVQMRDANIIIGYVENGTGFIRDDFGTGNVSHTSDLSLGGTNDATLLAASLQEGITTLKFRIPLNSGDPYDRVLSPGETYPVIFARGAEKDFDTMHTALGQALIKIR